MSARTTLTLIFAWSLASCSSGGGDGLPSTTVEPMPKLRAEGTRIVDESGDEVRLRGVNLGSWIFHENWISAVDYPRHARLYVLGRESDIADEVTASLRAVGAGDDDAWLARFRAALAARVGASRADAFVAEASAFPPVSDDSDLPLRLLLEDRFGVAGRDELLDVFQGAWIREADVAWLASQGFNVVRVPMGYRGLTSMTDKSPPTALIWNERAFARVEELLRWCEKHRVYAVLDVQESPGGHNDYSGPPLLYDDPAFQALTVELWEELSRRYRDRTEVAAYSLLAEPFGAPSEAARDDMYDKLVKAVRARGDDHLLVIHDGFRGMWTLPNPADYGWEGVVYSTHLFEFGVENLLGYQFLTLLYDFLFNAARAEHGVPYYIGSWSPIRDEDFAYEGAALFTDLYERSGWSWSLWTLKRIDDPIDSLLYGESTSWGLLGRLGAPFERPDLHRDDFATLARKLSAYADLDLLPNERLLSILKREEGVEQGPR